MNSVSIVYLLWLTLVLRLEATAYVPLFTALGSRWVVSVIHVDLALISNGDSQSNHMYICTMHAAACRHGEMTESAADKHHLRPIKTQMYKAYVTARLSNEIRTNGITGSGKPIPVILADKKQGYLFSSSG